jgi:membrane protein DedA with SNARE-associated domain
MPEAELVYLMLSLAVSTLVSEDLACITAGLMVSQGRIDFFAASLACFLGILAGDMLLYLAGRYLGRAALARRPLRWVTNDVAVDRASTWFRRRGLAVIFISRFTPGLRLPTYFAAGVLRTNPLSFLWYFSLACLLWAPSLVWFASQFGDRAEGLLQQFEEHTLWILTGLGLLVFTMTRLVVPLFTARGRRLWIGAIRRQMRWEYWPRWRLYWPVLGTIFWQSLRHRSFLMVTAVNPDLEGGGLVGESKANALAKLRGPGVPAFCFLPHAVAQSTAHAAAGAIATSATQRTQDLERWRTENNIPYPLILKPDAGERGTGVTLIQNQAAAELWFADYPRAAIAQPFIAGLEFGISYMRFPDESRGRVVSLSAKVPPSILGDGHSTIEQLILKHPRHVALARSLLASQAKRAMEIPADGEVVELNALGTHSRGAAFLDRQHLLTPELERAIDIMSQRTPGFYLGRYDVRVPSVEDFQAGRNLAVLELNGLTGEPAHIYDPQHSVSYARKVLRQTWRDAFAIAAINVKAGARQTNGRELWNLWRCSR